MRLRRSFLWDQRLNMLSGWGCMAVVGTASVIVALVVMAASVTVESRNCAYASRQFGRATHYDWLSTCWVRLDGQWIPRDRYVTIRQLGVRP